MNPQASPGPARQAPAWSLRQLLYFVTVAETGTITGAAELLVISPSAVASAVEKLEHALGVQLCVRRKAHGITLTAAGQDLLRRSRALLDHAGELAEVGGGTGGDVSGNLTLGCYHTLAPTCLPPLLSAFTAEHPRVAARFLEADQDSLQDGLASGEVDVAVLYDMQLRDDVAGLELFRTRPHVLLAAGHPLAGAGRVSLRDVAAEPFVLLDLPPSSRHAFSVFRHVGVEPAVRYRAAGLETVRALVGRGFGWSFLVQRPGTGTTYEGLGVAALEITDDVPDVRVLLARSRGARLSRAAEAFARTASAVFSPPG
ncbi:LysR substrate-binding domain-containing protein [Kineococcus sp. SYSU DK001]|uniref:LysR substrate-binding domain-containing protein n=1 Tax=Kineococcus sp. SYSU DK001 TaxID=3383122 RepID=UPI003D7DF0F1